MSAPPWIPPSYLEALAPMGGWLEALSRPGALRLPPTRDDSKTLASLFENLWIAAGMDASLGLARATPDQRLFRSELGQYFCQSPHLRRCLEKPLGYAGDYLMMEGVCSRPSGATTSLGAWLDAWFYEDFPPFVSVRHRRDMVAALLSEEHERGAARILNVACGGVPELAALDHRVRFAEIVLLDQDADALRFARTRLDGRHADARVTTINMPIRQLNVEAGGQFDVVYSMGLYDYLSDRQARRLTGTLWDMVASGGLLVIGNFQGHHWARYVMEAVMDWFLVYRNDDDMKALGRCVSGARMRVVQDPSGLLNLLQLRKT